MHQVSLDGSTGVGAGYRLEGGHIVLLEWVWWSSIESSYLTTLCQVPLLSTELRGKKQE